MARAPKPPKTEEPHEKVLPLPAPALRHHGETLYPVMTQWRDQKRVPPVLLLTGPAGVGKRSVAYLLSQWLLCERAGFAKANSESTASAESGDAGFDLFGGGDNSGSSAAPEPEPQTGNPLPCGECAACQRALSGNWVDFTEISGDTGDGETGSLKIEQFRKLKASMGFGAFDGAFKITLIRDADRMTVQAANSLLKLLEEPPPGWIFFLTASDTALVLPTIVSRCQSLRLRPFSVRDLKELLSLTGAPKDRIDSAAVLAQGSWTKAITLTSDETWDRRKTLFHFLEQPQAEINHLVDWATQDNSNFNLLLDQLEQLTADLIQWSVNPTGAEWTDPESRKSLSAHAHLATRKLGSAAKAREFWLERANRLFRIRQESLAPLNRKLLVQDLLIPWLEIGSA